MSVQGGPLAGDEQRYDGEGPTECPAQGPQKSQCRPIPIGFRPGREKSADGATSEQ